MRKSILFIILISAINIESQNLTDKGEINKFDQLVNKFNAEFKQLEVNNIKTFDFTNTKTLDFTNTKTFDFTDWTVQRDLRLMKLLRLERSIRSNKTWAAIFTIFSGLHIFGLILGEEDFKEKTIKSAVVFGGVSIPFWIGARKRAKERDILTIEMTDNPLK